MNVITILFGMDAVCVNNHCSQVKRESMTEYTPEPQEQTAEQIQKTTEEQTTE